MLHCGSIARGAVGLALGTAVIAPARGQDAATPLASGRNYGTVQAAAFNPDGSLLALAGSDRRIHLLGTPDGAAKRVLTVPDGAANCLAFDPRSSRLAAGGYNRVYIWDSATGAPVKAVDLAAGRILALTYMPSGARLAAAGSDTTVRVLDTASFAETARFATGAAASGALAFAPDGTRLAAGAGRGILIWELGAAAPRRLEGHAGGVTGLAFTSDGRALFSAGADGAVVLWDPVKGERLAVRREQKPPLSSLAASRDGRVLASAGRDRSILLRRGSDAEPLHQIRDLKNDVVCLALSRDAGLLAAGLRTPGASFALWRLDPKVMYEGGGIVPSGEISAEFLTKLEKEVAAEQNLARGDPKAYAEFARAYRRELQGNVHVSGSRRRTTTEGTAAVDEAVAFLEAARPVRALEPFKGMSLAAADHVADTGPKGMVGHAGSDGSQPADRMARHGRWEQTCGENISYGLSEARDIVLQLIIDDGVPGRGHRQNMFNPAFRVCGVRFGSHKQYGSMCVLTYAGGYKDK